MIGNSGISIIRTPLVHPECPGMYQHLALTFVLVNAQHWYFGSNCVGYVLNMEAFVLLIWRCVCPLYGGVCALNMEMYVLNMDVSLMWRYLVSLIWRCLCP